jgi:diaminopropionate ammonia-lyase
MGHMTSWYCLSTARDWTWPSSPGDAHAFHQLLPGYSPTPLVLVPELAAELGVGRVLVKDESSRLGLPAFKVLGASWACRQVLRRRPGATLVTATDGNHGRAVARMAAHFGVGATVFVPEVMLPETAARIVEEGATVVWVDGDYDDAVRRAADFAGELPDRALVQDTAWAGYEQVPAWIVEGYQTLVDEVDAQLGGVPDLVAVPVGVGSLAEAVVRHYRRPAPERALGRTRHRGVRPGKPDRRAAHHGGDRGDGDGRAQLRHHFQLRLAGAARRLRRGRRRQRRGRASRRGGPRPARCLLGP